VIDLALVILKFGGLLLSGFFGAYGLLVKFKDENGKITKSGRNALILIVTSTLVSGLSAAFEIYRDAVRQRTTLEVQAKETLETAKRTERLLSEINRSMQPISTLIVSHWISVPTDHLLMKSYISRFEAELPNALTLLTSTGRFPGYAGGSYDEGRNPIGIYFDGSAVLSPDRTKEKLAFTVLGYSEIVVEFFKVPIDPKSHYLISGEFNNKPDLTIRLSSGLDVSGMGGNHELQYNMKEKHFKLHGSDISTDSKYWHSTGNIVSIPDLAGSQIFISLPSVMVSGDMNEVDQYLPEIRRRFALDTLILNFGKGREFWLQSKELSRLDTKERIPLYVYTFPKTAEELNKLSR
jgi:hypothetical protein